MTIEKLKQNIENEKKIIQYIKKISSSGNYEDSINSLKNQIKILNNSVPALLESVSHVKKLDGKDVEKNNTVKLGYNSHEGERRYVTINKEDKEKFAKDLSFSEGELKKIKKEENLQIKPSKIAHISNMLFHNFSEKFSNKFTGVKKDLRDANIRFMISVYVSMALFVSLSAFAVSFVIFLILIFLNLVSWVYILSPFVIFALILVGFYFYPALEKGSVKKKISEELPFATIYMGAIAGSNIEPTKIFKIIAMSPEYKYVGFEIKKIINQVEIYGYDLVTALKNQAKVSTNKKLSELFSGMATNIVSGGSLKNYLQKRAENLLVDYKLERQRYSALAETFMDIYISILITAPLILMMLFVIMNVTGFGIGLSLDFLLIMSIGGVVLVNVIFLIILQIKQPKT